MPTILLEFNSLHFSFPSYLYLVKAIAGASEAELVAYSAYSQIGLVTRFWFRLRKALRLGKFGAYRSMGANQFLVPSFDTNKKLRAGEPAQTIIKGLASKRDLERLEIDGVWVGDLIYGSYVARHQEPTVDLDDVRLTVLLAEFILLVEFWKTWITSNRVLAVVSSHLVYEMGIPIRVANSLGIEGFLLPDLGNAVTRVTSKDPHTGSEYKYFPEDFNELDERTKKDGLEAAAQLLEERFRGRGAFNLNPQAAKSYSDQAPTIQLPFLEDGKPRILISPHLFWDSPHMYGEALFTDIYEWLRFIGEISMKTDYAWYLKPHPDGSDRAEKILYQKFKSDYPGITILPRDLSHHAIFAEGVDLVLTVHGQIAVEYSYHGIPVVNASQVNPHSSYSFSITPDSPSKLAEIIINAKGLAHEPDRGEILEFYFMQAVYYSPNVFHSDHQDAITKFHSRGSPRDLSLWLGDWNEARHVALLQALKSFVSSNDVRLSWKHFGHKSPKLNLL